MRIPKQGLSTCIYTRERPCTYWGEPEQAPPRAFVTVAATYTMICTYTSVMQDICGASLSEVYSLRLRVSSAKSINMWQLQMT